MTPSTPSLDWRPLATAHAADLVRLRAAAEAVDQTGEHFDEPDVLEELTDAQLDPARDTIGGWDGAQLVAYGLVFATTGVRDVDHMHVEGTIHPAWRRRGIGRHVLEWAAERARGRHAERYPDVPGEVHVSVLPTNAGQVALVERAGFTPVRLFHVMRRDPRAPIDPAPEVDGLRPEPFDFGYDDATRRARNVAFADHWGSVDRDEVVWKQWFTGQRAFRSGLSTLLIDDATPDDPVAGFSLSYEYEADEVAEGIRQVWLGQIGVRPEWRQRGAARWLMVRTLEAYRDAGFERAELEVDTDNASGAPRLYERTGWVPVKVWVVYARPITAPADPSASAVTRP
ncbi:MAG: GNAT family N-acetyltransferase [Acidimicrobiales bacterium]